MSQITTHILDTCKGKPANAVSIILFKQNIEEWIEISKGFTDNDGRILDLLENNIVLEHGIYKMKFDTAEYFSRQQIKTFYPFVEIIFTIDSNEHYHVPLLLNPFGYSTYRGS